MTFGTIFKKLIKNPTAVAGVLLLVGFAILAIWAPIIAPVPEGALDEQMMPKGTGFSPQPPSEEHILGTTAMQYDVLYGVVWGTRTAFRIGIGITLVTTLLGLMIGAISAFAGGWLDELIMRITEIFQAFPFLLTAIIMSSVLKFVYDRGEGGIMFLTTKLFAFFTFGQDFNRIIPPNRLSFLFGMMAIIMFGWMEIARVIRGNILMVKNSEYAQAAITIGAKNARILFRHLMPNAIFPILVMAPMNIGTYVLTFATLSYLGIGTPEGYADWGQMLSLARDWIPALADYPHIAVYPGLAIVLFILAWNLVGDGLRDILDPRIKDTKSSS
jgi:peptide/nickel transport system permease protein